MGYLQSIPNKGVVSLAAAQLKDMRGVLRVRFVKPD
jgi:hypothetical protein